MNYGMRFETLYRRQGSRQSPGKRNAKKQNVWEGLTSSCEKKRSEKQRRKGKIYPFECRVPKNSKEREIRKPSPGISAKKQRKTIEWELLEIS